MSQASLLRSDALHFFIGLDKVAAVCEARLLTDIIQIVVGKEQHIISLADLDELYVLLTGFTIQQLEAFRKIGVAHTTLSGQFFYTQQLIRMLIDVFGNIVE